MGIGGPIVSQKRFYGSNQENKGDVRKNASFQDIYEHINPGNYFKKLVDIQHELSLKQARINFHKNPSDSKMFHELLLALNRSGLHQEV